MIALTVVIAQPIVMKAMNGGTPIRRASAMSCSAENWPKKARWTVSGSSVLASRGAGLMKLGVGAFLENLGSRHGRYFA